MRHVTEVLWGWKCHHTIRPTHLALHLLFLLEEIFPPIPPQYSQGWFPYLFCANFCQGHKIIGPDHVKFGNFLPLSHKRFFPSIQQGKFTGTQTEIERL